MRRFYNPIRAFFMRLAAVRSAQGASIVMTAASFASKPLGYVRVLIIAWAFGTSAGMDAFYLASGIVTLFTATFTNSMESAVLPEIALLQAREGEESVRNLMAVVFWILIALTLVFVVVMLFFSEGLVHFFARGFDPHRLHMGGKMLFWLIPFCVASLLRAPADVWAMHKQQYTLSSICALVFNFIAIPSLLVLIPVIGVYSVALCMGMGTMASTCLLWIALRGFPIRFSFIPWESLRRVGKNTLLSVAVMGSGGLYIMVDRYFASLLPVGSVAAISYAGYIFGLLTALVSPPLFIFLAKASELVAEDIDQAEAYLSKALTVGFSYFTPIGLFVAAASYPIIALSLGWGNFGEISVSATSICLAIYCVGLPFTVLSSVLYRYAQAKQLLGRLVFISYFFVGLNALLNWIFAKWWGIGGLAFATTCTQFCAFLYLGWLVIKKQLERFQEQRILTQFSLSLFLASIAWSVSFYVGGIISIANTLLLVSIYFYLANWLQLFRFLPENWQPVYLFKRLSATAMFFRFNRSEK